MSSSSSQKRTNAYTVGDLHVGFRNMFSRWGFDASSLSTVARDNPKLMSKPATKSNMNKLVDIENRRARASSSTSPGDTLARVATPFRRATVHFAMTHAAIGRYGYSEMFHNRTGYGSDVFQSFSDITSGTF